MRMCLIPFQPSSLGRHMCITRAVPLQHSQKGKLTMLPVYAYGHDFGNAETCGVLFDRGIQRALTVPSATSLGRLYDLVQMRSALSESYASNSPEALKRGEYVLEYNGNELFVGNLALKQSR